VNENCQQILEFLEIVRKIGTESPDLICEIFNEFLLLSRNISCLFDLIKKERNMYPSRVENLLSQSYELQKKLCNHDKSCKPTRFPDVGCVSLSVVFYELLSTTSLFIKKLRGLQSGSPFHIIYDNSDIKRLKIISKLAFGSVKKYNSSYILSVTQKRTGLVNSPISCVTTK